MQRMLPQQRSATVKFQFIVMLLYMKWYSPINCGGIELNMSAIPPPPPWRGPQWLKKSFMLIGLTGTWPLDRVFSPSSYNTRQPQVNTNSVHVCLFVCSITFIGTNPATATTVMPHKGQIYTSAELHALLFHGCWNAHHWSYFDNSQRHATTTFHSIVSSCKVVSRIDKAVSRISRDWESPQQITHLSRGICYFSWLRHQQGSYTSATIKMPFLCQKRLKFEHDSYTNHAF